MRAILELKVGFEPAKMQRAADAGPLRGQIAAAGATVETALGGTAYTINRRSENLPYLAVTAPLVAIEKLHRSGRIASAQPDKVARPLLSDSTKIIGAAEAQLHGFDSSGQVVAVLDTGVDTIHSMFAGRVVDEACFSLGNDCPNGGRTQFGVGAGVPCTYSFKCDHGTHVAGIAVAARGGPINFNGVAPAAGLIAIQVFSDTTFNCSGEPRCPTAFFSDIQAGLDHVVSKVQGGMRVASVNISIGDSSPVQTACDNSVLKPAVDTLRALGVATVVASGNDFSQAGVSEPACISTVITVGNVTKSDIVAIDSNSSRQVELLAPGTGINSAITGGGTGFKSGTSMATPHVAGAWAIYRERFPTSSVTDALVALQDTGVLVADSDNGVVVPRLNVSAAMARYGFVFANQLTTASYTPDLNFQSNSTGATNRIERQGVGSYLVRMPGLGQVGGGTVQVSALTTLL